MQFRLLGSLEVSEEGRPIPLGGPRQRAALAHLVVRANRLVSTDELIDGIWGDDPPEAARNALHNYVSHLRKTVGPDRLQRRPPGYVLRVDPAEVDALTFEDVVREAREMLPVDPGAAVERFDEALALWRGPPLADLTGEPSLRGEVARLEELRLSAMEDRIEAQLALGRHGHVIGDLEALVARHPLRERLWSQLMLALYRSGRQGEALAAYRRLMTTLTEELGIDPSSDLQRLHERILRQDPELEPSARAARGYRLLERIGEGSFGVVHRAEQPQVGREVAVKVIRPRLANDPEFIRRFEAEAQTVARLEHPRIVPLYDYWREPDAAYLVMRRLRGGNLRETVHREPLGPEAALRVVEQVAEALAAAHRQGIVHRDVKPANILLDEEGNAYLSDFGIAWDAAMAEPRRDPTPWTTGYLSPEQIRGEPPTVRSDLYSLGVVLFEALAGRHPFQAASPEELAEMHLRQPLPSLTAMLPELPRAVEQVVRTATAKDPAERFPDAPALAAAFRAAVAPREAAPAPVALRPTNPYKGLRPFLEADAPDFFGRESLVQRLAGRLWGTGSRFLAVVGPSGAGKSSAVRAGLVPALRRGLVPGSENWFVAEMLPGSHPQKELETALIRVAVDEHPSLLEELEDEWGICRVAERLLPEGSELLLVVDQFEEVYTLVREEERRRRFLRSLVVAATDPGSRIRVAITLRADFYDRPLCDRGLGELIRSGTELVLPLASDELERAIVGPAERMGVRPEPGLVPEIVGEVTEQPGALPLLQYTLTELFERRRDETLTLEAYRSLGGVSGALVRRVEEIHRGLDGPGREALRQLFLRLVSLGEGTQDTRRRVPTAEVLSLDGRSHQVERVMQELGRFRLLSFDRDPETRAATVEVAHEALLTAWGRLQGWIDAAREDVRVHRRLAGAAAEWAASERDPSFLLRGARLDRFESWAAASDLALARDEREYLRASVARREAEHEEEREREEREASLQRRSVRRLRALVAVLAAASLIAAGLTGFAFAQRSRARQESDRAQRETRIATARELAAAAEANLDADPERAILLALEAVEATHSVDGDVLKEAEEALHRALQASRVVSSFTGLFGIQFSPDGSRVATSHADGTARIWNPLTGDELLALEGHGARTLSVDWSADGSLLATSSEDETAKVWDAETGRLLQTFEGHEGGLRSPHFSPDARLLATTSFDGTTRLWDVTSGKQIRVLEHTGGVEFSPDGTRLVASDPPITVYEVATGKPLLRLGRDIPDPRDATWSGDGSRIGVSDGDGFAFVFNAQSGERLLTLVGHNTGTTVGEIVFASGDAVLATAGSDGAVRVWDAESGVELLALRGLGGNVEGVDISPDGTLVAGSSGSGVAKVWDITPAGSRELLTIPAHTDIVWGMGITTDGRLLATGSVDGTAGVSDAATGERVAPLRGFRGIRVEDLAVSPTGSGVAAVGEDGRMIVWDATDGEPLIELQAHDNAILGVRFSPDGRRVITGDVDGVVRLWDAQTGERLLHIDAHDREIIAVGFSLDEARIVTGSMDETAKVWDARTGEHLVTMSRHQDNINAAVFSPDGSRLYTAGEDGVLKVWEVSTGRELAAFTGHAAGLLDVTLSPDGSRIATASRDGTARLWEPATGRELLSIEGHESGVSALAFSPDGTRLAAAGEDGSIRLYALSLDELVEVARERVTRSLTDGECRQYLHLDRCPTS